MTEPIMMTNYVSLDLETTGIDTDHDTILEIAAVCWDDARPAYVQPSFHSYVKPPNDRINIQWGAMDIHFKTGLLEKVRYALPIEDVLYNFGWWLGSMGFNKERKAVLLGKNVGSFDLQFLKRHPKWPSYMISHRSLDVGSLYATKAGVPSTGEIPIPYRIEGEEHTALYDARVSLAQAMEKLS